MPDTPTQPTGDPAALHRALVAAQSEMRAAHKTGDNKFDRYSYAKLEDFLDVAKPVLAKHGLALVLATEGIIPLEDRSTKNGGAEHAVRVEIRATLIHESGATFSVCGFGEGQDRADKAIYKAITGAKKYAIAGLLAIPTSDDPESDETVGLADAKGKTAKVDMATGETRTKKTALLPEQTAELGAIRKELMDYLEEDSEEFKQANAEITATWKQYAYSPATVIIDEIRKIHTKWLHVIEERAAKGTKA